MRRRGTVQARQRLESETVAAAAELDGAGATHAALHVHRDQQLDDGARLRWRRLAALTRCPRAQRRSRSTPPTSTSWIEFHHTADDQPDRGTIETESQRNIQIAGPANGVTVGSNGQQGVQCQQWPVVLDLEPNIVDGFNSALGGGIYNAGNLQLTNVVFSLPLWAAVSTTRAISNSQTTFLPAAGPAGGRALQRRRDGDAQQYDILFLRGDWCKGADGRNGYFPVRRVSGFGGKTWGPQD